MIFDRTQNDVDAAIRLRSGKVQNFQSLTADEIETLERGTLTITTLNRIENKQKELKTLFNDMGYWNMETKNKTWAYEDVFYGEDFQRILANTNILREAFFTYTDTPSTPPVSYHYSNINALEKILYDLDNMVDAVKNRYKRCGTFRCGELI